MERREAPNVASVRKSRAMWAIVFCFGCGNDASECCQWAAAHYVAGGSELHTRGLRYPAGESHSVDLRISSRHGDVKTTWAVANRDHLGGSCSGPLHDILANTEVYSPHSVAYSMTCGRKSCSQLMLRSKDVHLLYKRCRVATRVLV